MPDITLPRAGIPGVVAPGLGTPIRTAQPLSPLLARQPRIAREFARIREKVVSNIDKERLARTTAQVNAANARITSALKKLGNVEDAPTDVVVGFESNEKFRQDRLDAATRVYDALEADPENTPDTKRILAGTREADLIELKSTIDEGLSKRLRSANQEMIRQSANQIAADVREPNDAVEAKAALLDLLESGKASGMVNEEQSRALIEGTMGVILYGLMANPATQDETAERILREFGGIEQPPGVEEPGQLPDPASSGVLMDGTLSAQMQNQLVNHASGIMRGVIENRVEDLGAAAQITAEEFADLGDGAFEDARDQVDEIEDLVNSPAGLMTMGGVARTKVLQGIEQARVAVDIQEATLGYGRSVRVGAAASGFDESTDQAVSLAQSLDPDLQILVNDEKANPYELAQVFNRDLRNAGFVSSYWRQNLTRLWNTGSATQAGKVAVALGQSFDGNQLQTFTPQERGRAAFAAASVLSESNLGFALEMYENMQFGIPAAQARDLVISRRDTGINAKEATTRYTEAGYVNTNAQFIGESDPPAQMAIDFERLVLSEYMRNGGRIDEARSFAQTALKKKWSEQPTDFGTEWKQYHHTQRYGDFAEEQIRDEFQRYAMDADGNPIPLESVRLHIDPLPSGSAGLERPVYVVEWEDPNSPGFRSGAYDKRTGGPFVVQPDLSTSPQRVRNIVRGTVKKQIEDFASEWLTNEKAKHGFRMDPDRRRITGLLSTSRQRGEGIEGEISTLGVTIREKEEGFYAEELRKLEILFRTRAAEAARLTVKQASGKKLSSEELKTLRNAERFMENAPRGYQPIMLGTTYEDMLRATMRKVEGDAASKADPAPWKAKGITPPFGGIKESDFRDWYMDQANRLGINPDPDHPFHFYDWRAAWEAGAEADDDGNWPDTYRATGHPNRFIDGSPMKGFREQERRAKETMKAAKTIEAQ